MAEPNLKPEQIARETIDGLLRQSSWIVQSIMDALPILIHAVDVFLVDPAPRLLAAT